MTDELLARLDAVAAIDAAGLLSPAVRAMRSQLERDQREAAERRIGMWEDVLGADLPLAARAVSEVEGFEGYRAAAASFARRQEFRRNGLAMLSDGIARNDPSVVRRWRWIAWGYVGDVATFAAERRAVMETTEAVTRTRSVAAGDPCRDHVALRANLAARRARYPRSRPDGSTGRIQHNLARVVDVVRLAEELAALRRALAEERDALRGRAQSLGLDAEQLSRTARVPSLPAQVLGYRALLADFERAQRRRDITGTCGKVAAELKSLQELTGSGPPGTP